MVTSLTMILSAIANAGPNLSRNRRPKPAQVSAAQHLPPLAPQTVGLAFQDDDLGVWTRRSIIAATATGSPRISAHALKVLFELTMSERRS
jgi:hypothetical protein